MCCASIFISIMKMASRFSIIFIFFKLFYELFSTNMTFFCVLSDFSSFFVNTIIFFHPKSIIFLPVPLKIHKTFSCNFLHHINYAYFLYNQIRRINDIECPYYFFVFLLLKIFLDYFYSYLFCQDKNSMWT